MPLQTPEPAAPRVTVSSRQGRPWLLPFSLGELAKALELMGQEIFLLDEKGMATPVPVELVILNEKSMSALNLQYLQCRGPTNILAFPAASGVPDTPSTPGVNQGGSLALSAETLRREAFLYQQDLALYSLNMLAHGLGHLAGYRHGDAMRSCTEKAAAHARAYFLQQGVLHA